MDRDRITRHIADTYDDVHAVTSDNGTFFFTGDGRKFPFATIVASDNEFDSASDLDREGVFRLNIGVGRDTFRALFGDAPRSPEDSDHDFTALDRLMPHPMYGRMHWVCVLNPSEETFGRDVAPLLEESHRRDLDKRRTG